MRHVLWWTLLLVAARASADDEPPLITYIVTERTSCDRLAARLWGDRDKFVLIHAHNELGPLPHHLAPGTRLVIPVLGPLAPDALVSRAEGSVDARSPRDAAWRTARVGTQLYRAWRVFSRAESSAEVTYRDTSQIWLRENTVVVIYGPSAGAAQVAEAELESGALRARLAELAGRGPLVVRTESAEAELVAGQAVLAALAGGRTAVSNHEGRPVAVRGRRAGARAVAVDAGMGTDVARGADPTPPRALPATPAWSDGPTAFVATGDVTASWRAVAGAAGYRVELARDAGGDDVVGQVAVGQEITAYVGRGLAAGVYFLGVSAVDAAGLEGRPSAPRRLVVAAVTLAPGTTGVTVGAVVAAPCTVGDGAGRVLRAAGRVTLRCGEEVGSVEVAPLPVTVSSPGPLAVAVAAPPELAAAVELRGPPGVTFARRADGAFDVVAAKGAPAAIAVTAVLPVHGEELPVGTITALRPRPPPPGLELALVTKAAAYHGLDLGDNGVPELALVAGLRVTRSLGARFAIEAELAAGTLRLPSERSAATAAYAARGVVRLGGGRLRPVLGAGITLQDVFRADGVVPAFRYGPHALAAVELDLARWRLRVAAQPWLTRAGGDTGAATWVSLELALRL